MDDRIRLPTPHKWKYIRVEFYNIRTGESMCKYVCERCGMSMSSFKDPDLVKSETGCEEFLLKSVMGE